MANKDYEQKKAECWHEYFSSDKRLTTTHEHEVSKDAFYAAFDRAYSLGKQEKDAEKISSLEEENTSTQRRSSNDTRRLQTSDEDRMRTIPASPSAKGNRKE